MFLCLCFFHPRQTETGEKKLFFLWPCDNSLTSAYSWILMSNMFPMAAASDDGGRGLLRITLRKVFAARLVSGSCLVLSIVRWFVRLECRRHSQCSSRPGTFRKTHYSNNSNLRGRTGQRGGLTTARFSLRACGAGLSCFSVLCVRVDSGVGIRTVLLLCTKVA